MANPKKPCYNGLDSIHINDHYEVATVALLSETRFPNVGFVETAEGVSR